MKKDELVGLLEALESLEAKLDAAMREYKSLSIKVEALDDEVNKLGGKSVGVEVSLEATREHVDGALLNLEAAQKAVLNFSAAEIAKAKEIVEAGRDLTDLQSLVSRAVAAESRSGYYMPVATGGYYR